MKKDVMTMVGLEKRVREAKENPQAMDDLLRDYLPFLKKQAQQAGPDLDYDDRLSLAMIAFLGAVRQYDGTRGAFLPFAQTCIRNRLIDEGRRERRYSEQVMDLPEDLSAPDNCALALERSGLAEEIAQLGTALAHWGVSFAELAALCPSQRRARIQCLTLAACITADPALREEFSRSGRLPQSELARRFHLSPKTVEKHRKYIVALAVLLLGDYPGIRAFLPKKEAEA